MRRRGVPRPRRGTVRDEDRRLERESWRLGAVERAPALDLQRARRALGDYLAAHPPCADDLERIAATEQTALDELDAAIASLEGKDGAAPHLAKALASLRSAQSALIAGQ